MWAKCGFQPQIKSAPTQEKVAFSGFVNPATGQLIINERDKFNYETIIESVKSFAENIPKNVWMFSAGNEPDLTPDHRNDPSIYLNKMIQITGRVCAANDNRNLISEPSICRTDDGGLGVGSGYSSLTWLDDLYSSDEQNGLFTRSLFDVFDVHAYCKIMDGTLPWSNGKLAYPEVLSNKIQNVRNVMQKYSDGNKPMIFTEMGWCTDENGHNYNRIINEKQQSDYIVREYLLAISLGIHEGYLYQFQNNGINPYETEDMYGIVDWYGTPRAAYYGYYIISSMMQGASYIRETENISAPYYGLEFENSTGYFTAIWNATDEFANLSITPINNSENGLKIVFPNGSYKYVPIISGQAIITISGTPAFIHSNYGIYISQVN